MSVFIIAEAGVNHNGDMEIAKKLIEAAKDVGADAVKFQSFTSDGLLSEDVKLEHVEGGSLIKLFDSVSLSVDDHIMLKEYCDNVGIEFMSTPFDFERADLLERLGVARFKIASCDINNIPFLKYVARKGRPMIVSTGTASIREVQDAYFNMTKHIPDDRIHLLHCVANYPTELKDVNLARMLQIQQYITTQVGFSDHTLGNLSSTIAALWGAQVIERHFTLDKMMPGPDQKLSSEPAEFKQLVHDIRNIQYFTKQIGDISDAEREIALLIRRSIVSAYNIRRGTTLTHDLVAYKRPGTGLAPGRIGELIGRKTKRDIKKNERLKIEDFV
jgi:sialic acid synthase SpsE